MHTLVIEGNEDVGGEKLRTRRLFVYVVLLILGVSGLSASVEADGDRVLVVPLQEEVEKGLYGFLERAINTAETEQYEAVIIQMDTPGGAVNAAFDIGKLFSDAEVETITYVDKNALSAGAYISLNTDRIYMAPGSVMGAAQVIDGQGNAAGDKAQSAWIAAMRGSAEDAGLDPTYAIAMADPEEDVPEYGAPSGKLLTLTSTQAEEVGYSKGTADSLDELLTILGFENAQVDTFEQTFADKLARFLTNPVIVPILLSIGSIGLVVEIYSPGFGVPGIMGLGALLLFFFGHLFTGLAGYETILLFVGGLILLVIEFFLPGGVAGILGMIAVIVSLFMAGESVQSMGISLAIALFTAILAGVILVKFFGKRLQVFNKMILRDSTNTESGYVSNVTRVELVGKAGRTLTPLRPSGTVLIEEERVDAVSEGGFIEEGNRIRVVKTEGVRVVVREIPDLEKENK